MSHGIYELLAKVYARGMSLSNWPADKKKKKWMWINPIYLAHRYSWRVFPCGILWIKKCNYMQGQWTISFRYNWSMPNLNTILRTMTYNVYFNVFLPKKKLIKLIIWNNSLSKFFGHVFKKIFIRYFLSFQVHVFHASTTLYFLDGVNFLFYKKAMKI